MASYDNWHYKVFNATSADIYGLTLKYAAFVYPAPEGVQTVSAVIKSDSKRLVNAFEFKETQDETPVKVLDVQIKNTWGSAFLIGNSKYILDIYVPRSLMRYIVLHGDNDVAMLPGTIVNDTSKTLQTKVAGSGSLFVKDSAIAINALVAEISGDGLVQLDISNFTMRESLISKVSGSGDVVVATDYLTTQYVDNKISGSGKIFVGAKTLFNATSSMKSLVTGSGQISYYETGVTPKHEIKVDGSGTIQAGSIVTQEVNAAISGGGSIYSNAVKSIVSVKRGSGDIFLVGNSTPGVISFDDYVPKTAANAVSRYTTQALPAHDSSEVFWFGWGFAVLIGIVGLAIVGVLIRKFGVRCCRKRQQVVVGTPGPYDVAVTPVVIVNDAPVYGKTV